MNIESNKILLSYTSYWWLHYKKENETQFNKN